jgi:amidase
MKDITFLSATELLKKLKSREISAVELLEKYLNRVERLNPDINAVVVMDHRNARLRAEKADQALAKGEDWGPLHGLPITIKESIAVAGITHSGGSPERKHVVPEHHADVVQSLIDAGAIVFGKTNIPLFGMDFQSYNEVYGQTNNPWDLKLTPGGSSGGAAAAIAAGMSGLEIGSDIGGSIRIPAHFCGIFAHKPTFNIVPLQGHIPFPALMADHNGGIGADIVVIGPLARSARDIEQVMTLIARPAKTDRTAWRIELPPPRKSTLREYKIGLWLDDPANPVDSQVGDRIQSFVDELSTLAPSIADRRPEVNFLKSHALYVGLSAALNGSTLSPEVFEKLCLEKTTQNEPDDNARSRFIRGATQLHRQWILLHNDRIRLQQQWAEFFKEFDVLLMPVAPVAAFPHDHGPFYDRHVTVNGLDTPYVDALYSWAGLAGVAYLPATVVPVGLTSNGLPVGIQIVGPYLEDRTTIHVATLIEDAMGGFVPPSLF